MKWEVHSGVWDLKRGKSDEERRRGKEGRIKVGGIYTLGDRE